MVDYQQKLTLCLSRYHIFLCK